MEGEESMKAAQCTEEESSALLTLCDQADLGNGVQRSVKASKDETLASDFNATISTAESTAADTEHIIDSTELKEEVKDPTTVTAEEKHMPIDSNNKYAPQEGNIDFQPQERIVEPVVSVDIIDKGSSSHRENVQINVDEVNSYSEVCDQTDNDVSGRENYLDSFIGQTEVERCCLVDYGQDVHNANELYISSQTASLDQEVNRIEVFLPIRPIILHVLNPFSCGSASIVSTFLQAVTACHVVPRCHETILDLLCKH
jgi:hypothetical protein